MPSALHTSTEGHMKRAFFQSISVVIGLAAISGSSPRSYAFEGWYPGYCSDHLDKHFDGSTLCAWKRTWHEPNALATPLRGYYTPRPPQCCGCSGQLETTGYATCDQYYTPSCMNCQCSHQLASATFPPDVSVAIGPAQFQRLGKVANQLDTLGPITSPAHSSVAPAGR